MNTRTKLFGALMFFSLSAFPVSYVFEVYNTSNSKIIWNENGKMNVFDGYEFASGYVKDYNFASNDLALVYFKGGATAGYVRSKYPKAKKIFPAGYTWNRKPVDYVEIGRRIVQPRTNLRAVLGLVKENDVYKLASAYDPKNFLYENRDWLVALGPWWDKSREGNYVGEKGEISDDGIYDLNRDENRYRYTDRNALFLNSDGTKFAVFSGKGSVRGVIRIAKETGWSQVFILDGGSSLSSKARNPVYFILK